MSKETKTADIGAAEGKLPAGCKMVSVRINKDRNDKRTHQFVSVNNRNYMVKIGEWVEVPDFVAAVLSRREERMEAADAYIAAQSK